MCWPEKKLREKAIRMVMEHMHYEYENTRYICIGPINKKIKFNKENHFMHSQSDRDWIMHYYPSRILLTFQDPNSEAFKLHLPRIYDYLWLAEDGMKMQVLK
ncbi:hypothetical protein CsSME_00051721 [Camellia sinensis var. sinensis]